MRSLLVLWLECSPARSAVGLPLRSSSGGGQGSLQDLQGRPQLDHRWKLADGRTEGKRGGGGSAEGQLRVLSHSGVQNWTPAHKTHKQKHNGVSFIIINDQDALSRSMYKELKKRAPERVPVYQQSANQSDVWELLEGDKDDILIYDWCGHLTFHMVVPFSFLHNAHVENAISATYQRNICNCSTAINHAEAVEPSSYEDSFFEAPDLSNHYRPHHHHFD